jgi:hypothetical protein
LTDVDIYWRTIATLQTIIDDKKRKRRKRVWLLSSLKKDCTYQRRLTHNYIEHTHTLCSKANTIERNKHCEFVFTSGNKHIQIISLSVRTAKYSVCVFTIVS